jgi:diadenosine tetraphosphate (Ap4A) HIT family hydrolase
MEEMSLKPDEPPGGSGGDQNGTDQNEEQPRDSKAEKPSLKPGLNVYSPPCPVQQYGKATILQEWISETCCAEAAKYASTENSVAGDSFACLQERDQAERPPKISYKPFDPSDAETRDYESNPTVFGKILRGEVKTRFLLETKNLVAFEDRAPRAPVHLLIVSKAHIPSVLDLTWEHLPLLEELRDAAKFLLEDRCLFRGPDSRLCFHIPPFHGVDHLHLHVLAPCSSMESVSKRWEFPTPRSSEIRWNISLETVVDRLKDGEPPTPYDKDDHWTTTVADVAASVWGMFAPPVPSCASTSNFSGFSCADSALFVRYEREEQERIRETSEREQRALDEKNRGGESDDSLKE